MCRLILEALTTWNVPIASDERIRNADVIVTHEFGDQHTLSKTTEQMAQLAMGLSTTYSKPWIAQFPGNTASSKPPFAIIKSNVLKPGAYLDTEEVNRQAAVICKTEGWKTAILITHPHHAWRAGKNLEHNGMQVVFPDLYSIKYDSHTKRPEVASPLMFIPREIIARILYISKGYLR